MYNTLPLVAAEVSLSCVVVSGTEASELNAIPPDDVVSSSAVFLNLRIDLSSDVLAVEVLISSSSSEYSSSLEL